MKTKLITLLVAIFALLGSAYAQKKIEVYKNGEIILSEYVTEIDSIKFEEQTSPLPNTHNGHEYVDLGLPSGIKWATCNVGATTPEEYGDYFAWGETAPKTTYRWSTYKYCKGDAYSITKYCTQSIYGTVDNRTVLELEDDAARANWGGKWRMPTKEEIDELRDTNNCTWESITQNGVNGYKVISKINGNSIFLPAAGWRDGNYLYNAGSHGNYWSSSLYEDLSYDAYFFNFNLSYYFGWGVNNRDYGRSVRAVYSESTPESTPVVCIVSVSATEGGEVVASATEVEKGSTVTLTATPKEGFEFVNWTLNGDVVSTENPYTATVTENSEFVANFEEEVSDSGISLTKGYRIKHVESGMYLNVENIEEHTGGTNGGVNCVAYAISNNQIFSFEAVGSNFYLKSKSGYYIYCQDWNVDALSQKTALTFTENEDGTYYILNGSKYFKVEQVNGTYYPFGDAPADLRATWVLEEAIETPPTTAVYNGHEYVDLGLPSGIKWATCNVGATTPEEYGDYFAWGETEPKNYYAWSTYKYCNGHLYSMTKYCYESGHGTVDNKTTLELADDAARANWGGNWRMPTYEELSELKNTSNCIWEWTTQKGVNGYKVTSKKNGNSIFLPAASYRDEGSLGNGGYSYGYYWSSSLCTKNHSNDAGYLVFMSGSVVCAEGEYRCRGLSVRAVCE